MTIGYRGPGWCLRTFRWTLFFGLLLGWCAAASLWAQETNPDLLEKTRPVARSHAGDDLRWADPAFDDRDWPVLSQPASVDAGWTWYRMRMQLPADHHAMEVGINAPANAFEAYVDGRKVEGYEIRSWLKMSSTREFTVPLPQREGSVEVAFRFYMPRLIVADFNPVISFRFETPETLALRVDDVGVRELMNFLPNVMINLVIVLGGVGILVLYGSDGSHREYLWAGLFLVVMGVSSAAWKAAINVSAVPFWVSTFVSDPLAYLQMFFQIEFTFAFLRRPVNRIWRIVEDILLFGFVLEMVSIAGFVHPNAFIIAEGFLFLVPALGLPLLLLIRFRKGSAEAGLLILPSLLPAASIAMSQLPTLGTLFHTHALDFFAFTIDIGQASLNFNDLADLIFLVAIGAVLLYRFTKVGREQARAAAELEAAREVQQRLVPVELPSVNGYALEAAYLPANEVGGDFYQVLVQADGSSLIVVGDVSGKGLKAAMTGVLAIGAIRTLAAEGLRPAELLRKLNAQMVDAKNEGFITCICARLETGVDGNKLTIANAGHLAPYRNGEEVLVDFGFPLGIVGGAEYGESVVTLGLGERITFLSDGVLEARGKSGELLGFARMAALSVKPAAEIADAAKAFGQDDDITVLTLEFAGAEVTLA
jgi:phosphoserine phosphatase RsbU/P